MGQVLGGLPFGGGSCRGRGYFVDSCFFLFPRYGYH